MKIIDSKLQGNVLQEFTDDYLEKHKELIKYVKEETKKQLTLTDVGSSLPTKEDDTEYWVDLVNWESGGIEEVSNKNLLNFKNDINLEIQKRLKQ